MQYAAALIAPRACLWDIEHCCDSYRLSSEESATAPGYGPNRHHKVTFVPDVAADAEIVNTNKIGNISGMPGG